MKMVVVASGRDGGKGRAKRWLSILCLYGHRMYIEQEEQIALDAIRLWFIASKE